MPKNGRIHITCSLFLNAVWLLWLELLLLVERDSNSFGFYFTNGIKLLLDPVDHGGHIGKYTFGFQTKYCIDYYETAITLLLVNFKTSNSKNQLKLQIRKQSGFGLTASSGRLTELITGLDKNSLFSVLLVFFQKLKAIC
jgi:hypothetical protein